jgi:hypothetical protein
MPQFAWLHFIVKLIPFFSPKAYKEGNVGVAASVIEATARWAYALLNIVLGSTLPYLKGCATL